MYICVDSYIYSQFLPVFFIDFSIKSPIQGFSIRGFQLFRSVSPLMILSQLQELLVLVSDRYRFKQYAI